MTPMMCRIKTPPITYKALTGGEHGHEEEDSPEKDADGHGHEPYTISSLHKVLEEGINPAGKKLDSYMPRWKLSDEDFRDLVAYLMYFDELSDEHAHEDEKHSEPHQ